MSFVKEIEGMIGALKRSQYPGFILRKEAPARLPVFIFHHIDSRFFEKLLVHLKKNGYETIVTDDPVAEQATPPNQVMITFDDGWGDLYTTIFPLLKKYQFKIVVFLVPSWVGNSGVLNLEQIREMHQSGWVDFQAHTQTHSVIPVSPKIVDFYHPSHFASVKWRLLHQFNGYDRPSEKDHLWGKPVYESVSSLSEKSRYLGQDALETKCIETVREQGGEDFFRRFGWKKQLFRIAKNFSEAEPVFESAAERQKRLSDEIRLSRESIERMLPEKRVRALAFPHNTYSEEAVRLLEMHGYDLAFGGMERNSEADRASVKVKVLLRVSGEFILCLPGKGRRSFIRVMLMKILRRIFKGPTY